MAKNSIWDIPPPVNLNSYSSFSQQPQQQVQPTRNYQTTDSHFQGTNSSSSSSQSMALGGIGTCVKIANVDKETTYGDIRKFFGGLAIGNNDIKFITDSKGDPTGVAVVRFVSSDSKKQALTKNGWQLKSTQIFISSITEEDYENGLEGSLKPRGSSSTTSTISKRYEDTRRHRDRSDSRERERDRDRDYDRYGNNHQGNNNFRGRNDNRSYGRDNYNNNNNNNNNSQRGSYQNGNNNYRNNNFNRRDQDNYNNRNHQR